MTWMTLKVNGTNISWAKLWVSAFGIISHCYEASSTAHCAWDQKVGEKWNIGNLVWAKYTVKFSMANFIEIPHV